MKDYNHQTHPDRGHKNTKRSRSLYSIPTRGGETLADVQRARPTPLVKKKGMSYTRVEGRYLFRYRNRGSD